MFRHQGDNFGRLRADITHATAHEIGSFSVAQPLHTWLSIEEESQ
jgi:hypothetical protein